ncbi:hypothetical protein ACFX1X_018652 [Malus domestica]
MKDGRHMLSGAGMVASSPRFKSKRQSEGPYIFKDVEERRGWTTLDGISEIEEASLEIEEANSKNEEALAFLKAGLAQKPQANLLFQICSHLSHATSTLDGAQNSKSKEALAFPDVSAPVTCILSFAEITGSLSKHRFEISKRHLLFQMCQPVTCTLSLTKITGNLSKISCEVEGT